MASISSYLQILVYLTVMLIALCLAIIILKRSKNQLTITLAIFFISIAIGALCSSLSRLATNESFKEVSNILAAIFVGWCMIQLTFFLDMLLRSKEAVSISRQITGSCIYFGLMLVFFFIPDGVHFEVDINDTSYPVWSLIFAIYGIIVQQTLFLVDMFLTKKLMKSMNEENAKKRFGNIMIALIILDYILVGTFVVNFLNNSIIRTIFAITGISVFIALYYFYLGLVKHLND